MASFSYSWIRVLLALAFAVGLAGLFLGWWESESATRIRHVYDEGFERQPTTSQDLAADREHMWKTVPSAANPPSDFEVSPVSAINAASRVFESVNLIGLSADEVAKAIEFRTRTRYGYNFPFYPTEKQILSYRFDCGNFGWQFNLVLDDEGRVLEVKRLGIE